jgi:hypothetical protein
VRCGRTWLDTWSGIGHIAVGMHRQGFALQLTQYDERGWQATFYTTEMEHSPTSATDQGTRSYRRLSLAPLAAHQLRSARNAAHTLASRRGHRSRVELKERSGVAGLHASLWPETKREQGRRLETRVAPMELKLLRSLGSTRLAIGKSSADRIGQPERMPAFPSGRSASHQSPTCE